MSSTYNTVAMGTQAISSMLSGFSNYYNASRSSKADAASYERQSLLYSQSAGISMAAANAYSGAAKAYINVGKANANQERRKASQIQPYRDLEFSATVKDTQQKVGAGLAGAAANGILLEGREGASIAMWEQDEAAENALAQLYIMQEAENQVWNFMTSANNKEAEGYGQAAQAYGQAASMAADAYASRLRAQFALADADAARKQARRHKRSGFGSVVGGVVGAAAGFVAGGPMGAAAGMQMGSSAGQLF